MTGATVLEELAGGTTFAEAAKKYSADKTLAESGGLVKSADGVECIAGDQFNPALIKALEDAKVAVGEPAAVSLKDQEVLVLLRPYDELTLSDGERLKLSANDIGAVLNESYRAAKIEVAERIGTWDPELARVVATGNPAGTSPAGTLPVTTG